MRAIDLAPTIAYLMDIPEPQNARGKVLLNIIKGGNQIYELQILDISDYHGQLTPLTEAADNVSSAGAANPVFPIGGSAFLKPWFDAYRAEAPGEIATLTAGDAVGATPPISAFFGDKPTIEMQNLMGFDFDGLGNHNFDRGAAVPPQRADPARRLRLRLVQHRGRRREDAGRVVEVEGRADRARPPVRDRRLLESRHPRADEARVARAVPRGRPARGGERRGGEDRQAAEGRGGDRGASATKARRPAR